MKVRNSGNDGFCSVL